MIRDFGQKCFFPDPAHVAQDTRPHAYTVSAVPDRCCDIFGVRWYIRRDAFAGTDRPSRMLKIANPNIKKVLGENGSSPDSAHVAQDTRPHAYTVSAVPGRCCDIFGVRWYIRRDAFAGTGRPSLVELRMLKIANLNDKKTFSIDGTYVDCRNKASPITSRVTYVC